MSRPIYVIGHINPDTDASTAATGYASFLNTVGRYDVTVQAVVPGKLTPQARWVFEQAGLEPPQEVDTFAPRVRDVATLNPVCLKHNDRLGTAIDSLIREGHSALPVVDEDGQLTSAFSNREDVSRFLMNFDVMPIAGSLLTWTDLVELPGSAHCGASNAAIEFNSLLIAMGGNAAWRELATPDDVLVCGDASLLEQIAPNQRPTRVVVIGTGTAARSALSEQLAGSGVSAVAFPGEVSDFFRLLTHQIRLNTLDLGQGPCVGQDDLLSDVERLVKECRRAVPVIDMNNRVCAVIARGDLEHRSKQRVVLVDHFEASQAVDGLSHLEVIEVVDHHRVGNIETDAPIRVDCRPIGSSGSIVALNFFEAGLEPEPGIARLLLGGLCADTLALKGPTATDIDADVAEKLARIAGVDLSEFGQSVLRAGDDLLTASAADIWNRDQKVFGIRNQQFAVAQLETVALDDLPEHLLNAFREQLRMDFEKSDLLSSVLVVTDVLTRNSWITAFEAPAASGSLHAAFGNQQAMTDWIEAKDIVSRKKQIIPRLMKTLAQLSS